MGRRNGARRRFRPAPGGWPIWGDHPAFGPFEETTFRHAHRRTPESLVETISTHSRLIVAEAGERARTREQLLEFLRTHPDTAGGEFDLPLVTTVLRAVRR
ncbi:hypothetical protein L1857_34910 [Amycolatopsis thermalba]|uniref:Uncharacterized protein n=1 Tax=Amycolatopsis thermalba TaxID=944492 RepID=A0ABY4P5C1_9PSEU|nr:MULTISPECIES: hypothetical protein [Amycolatopsis]UQS27625.1 hypothetical protein L1857_34910 [Amycolatopsis thermalba]